MFVFSFSTFLCVCLLHIKFWQIGEALVDLALESLELCLGICLISLDPRHILLHHFGILGDSVEIIFD